MPQQVSASIENNFTRGLITEATGLSFPENAAFDTQNCIYTLIGDVTRRGGFDFETNFQTDTTVNRTGLAMSTYKWNNVGGDGSTQIVVRQIGTLLYFFQSSSATIASPLSRQKLLSTIDITAFKASGSGASLGITECTYADGNGYLFVYHKDCDPFYCYYVPASGPTPAAITPNKISIQIRDFFGIYPEPGGPPTTSRPTSLTAFHNYNLQNQGWTSGTLWSGSQALTQPPTTLFPGPNLGVSFSGSTASSTTGNVNFTVQANIAGVAVGQPVTLNWSGNITLSNGGQFYSSGLSLGPATGSVISYTAATGAMTVNIAAPGASFTFSGYDGGIVGCAALSVTISLSNSLNTINTWQTAVGNYPSNADIWWRFKNTSGVFSPTPSTIGNTTLPNARAPNGHFIYDAFNQGRSTATGISGLTSVTTTLRPTNGAWFQGRVWYTGVNASQTVANELGFYTWTENIYFSQVIENASQFGYCYQENDPTDQDFFDLLPTDGGVITIQGTGQIYRLFPIQNGLLVFAANGIWFITGSQGIGFSATDYTITKISGVQAISSNSFINVNGYPFFWNEEGIYNVSPGQTGALQVNNMCVGTILTYYSTIPLQSKKFARGDYNPVDYLIQWSFRSTNESSVTTRYQFDSILNFNTVNKAFYPYTFTVGATGPFIHDIRYVAGPGGSTSPSPVFKYLVSNGAAASAAFTWAEENDITNWKDWNTTGAPVNYTSYFITGYRLPGQAQRRWQPGYIYLFCRNSVHNSYKIQGLWDFGITGNSGKWSTVQVVNDFTSTTNFGNIFRRHKIRGHGLIFQMKVQSVDGKPFDIVGWSTFETQNAGV